MIKKPKALKFSSNHEFIETLKPAKSYIPSWYRKAEQQGNILTFKHCMPFLDAMTSGYIIELSQDVRVEQNEAGILMSWGNNPEPVVFNNTNSNKDISVPKGYDDTINAAWLSTYNFKTPEGYSMLVTHPFNHYELPFLTTSGIIDTDKGIHSGKIPFFILKGFEGVIPKGTPIVQYLPFKRDNWKTEEDESLKELGKKSSWEQRNVFAGWYKKNRWSKKTYE